MIKLSPEQPEEGWEVETLYDLCFAPGREGLSSYRLRDGVAPAEGLSHVARDEFGELAGAIRYWPVRIGPARALLLGPVAVHPTRQGEGVGGLLIRESLAAASAGGWARVMLVGDAPYYVRFGFTPLANVEMPPPTNPARVLGFELQDGAWNGITGKVTKDA
ncbi:GNAT family N-acetyltransferase [Lentibacter sp. XHP0401]|uniref:GNAT family N-acetyltransferase n=1 Tax=Lentibacter sp. XHP0401 TaxID=2984334 RepID=UPI0021E7518D|nr:N-acetyltransferase [Lentibacter sp. XHP0401]MCV2894446.1 N-acetyltransferase [Lentibacter sp. XHP0401]